MGSAAANRKIALHAVLAKLRRKMLCVESMMTSIEINSAKLPGLCLACTALDIRQVMVDFSLALYSFYFHRAQMNEQRNGVNYLYRKRFVIGK
jgi:hypothetical protein